jgi:cystathionine beta-lyase
MWVADMDFKSPPEVIEAAKKACESGVFGYSYRSYSSIEAYVRWAERRHNWKINPGCVSSSPGIVTALPLAVNAFTSKGDKVMIQPPVYPPFFACIKDTGRNIVTNPLINNKGYFEIDFEDFENKLKSGVKLFILCSPHNPVGRVWKREELKKMGELCVRNGVLILSDEIHCDLGLFGNRHIPIASISPEISAITLTATAPSKTFNIAGMMNSVIVATSAKIMEAYNKELLTLRLETGNLFGHITMEAAYNYGERWLEELVPYLENNINYFDNFLKSEIPCISFNKPEASFLLWADFRQTGYNHGQIMERLIKVCKLGFNDGMAFGNEGEGFMRINIAAPLSIIKEATERLAIGFKVK